MSSDEKKNIIDEWFSSQPKTADEDIPLLDAELIESAEATESGREQKTVTVQDAQVSQKIYANEAERLRPPQERTGEEWQEIINWQEVVSYLEDEAKTRGQVREASLLFNSAGIILGEKLKQPRNAAIDFQNAFNIDFSYFPNVRSAIRLFYYLGNYQMAVQLLQLMADNPQCKESHAVYFEIAFVKFYYLGDINGARDALIKALSSGQDSIGLLAFLNNIYYRSRNITDLVNVIDQLTHQKLPEHYLKTLLFFEGKIFEERLNDVDMALRCYERIFMLDPSDRDSVLCIENILMAKKQYAELASVLKQHSNALPPERRTDIYNKLVVLYKNYLNDPDAVINYLSEILRIRSGDLAALDELLGQYYQKNEYDKIAGILRKISELTSDKNVLANLYFRLGTIYEEKLSNEVEAIEYYKKIVEISSSYQPAYAALGRLLARHGKWEDLVRLMEMEISQTEDTLQKVARYYKMAEIIEVRIQDLNRAIGVYRKILQIKSSYLPALKALGTLYGKLGMHQELINMFEEEIKITEDKEQIAFLLDKIGITYEEKLNDKEKAAETYRRILDIIPDHLPTIRTLARLYARLGRWEDLIKMCEIEAELIKDQIQIVSLLHKIGETYEENLKNIDEAVRYYKKALMISPNYLPALKSLGNIYLYQERYEELIDMYKREIEVTRNQPHNISLYHKIAQIYEDRLNMPERAISVYEEVLLIDAYNLPAINALKNIYLKLRTYDRYIEILLREVELVTDVLQKAYIFYQVGDIYINRLKNFNKGIEYLKKSLGLNKDNSNARLLLIDSLRQNGRYSELADLLIELASQMPADLQKAELYWELAQIFYFKLKEVNRAVMYLEKIIAIEPGFIRALMMLASIYREEKEYIKLITVLEKISSLNLSSDILVSVHLELAALKETVMKMPTESYIHYIKVLELQPSNRLAIDALERAYSRMMDTEGLSLLYKNYLSRLNLENDDLIVENFRLSVLLLGNPKTAENGYALLSGIIEKNPDYIPAYILLRDYALKNNRFAEFVSFSRVLAEKVRNGTVRRKILTEAAIVLEEKMKDISQATSLYLAAFEILPSDGSVFARLESLLSLQNRNDELASLYLKRISAISDNSEKASLYVRLSRLLEKDSGKITEAVSAYKNAVALDPYNEEALISLSGHLINLKMFDDAINYLGALVSCSKSQEVLKNAYLNLGILLYTHRQDYNGALINFQKAVSIEQSNIVALEYMGVIYYTQNNYDYALRTYQYLVSLNPGNPKSLEYLYTIAGIYENNLSNIEGAIETLKSGLRIDPTNEQLLGRLVNLCERANRIEELLQIYESVISSFPEHEKINAIPLMIKKAEIYTGIRKSLTDAERELKRVIQIAPNNILAHTMLAKLYSSEPSLYPQAVIEYRTLIQIDPFNAENLRALSRIFNQMQHKDGVFNSIGALMALKSATNDEEFAYGETRHRIEAVQGVMLKNDDIDLYLVHHRARGLFREILSVINEDLHDIFNPSVEKFGPEVKKTRMTRKSNDRIRARCDDVARILNIGEYNLYIAEKQGVLQFVEPTDPPSVIIGGDYVKLPPDEQKFGFGRMLYFIADRQIAAASLDADELKILANGILLLVSPDRFGREIKDETSINMSKRLSKGLSRKSRGILMSMQDRISELLQIDMKMFKKASFMSADRLGLFVTSSPMASVSYIYRVAANGRQIPQNYSNIVDECNRNEEIRDILSYSVSDEFLRLREKTGICIK
ncbi:MAG: tetratricopeptide repeat protein [Deltaproteobacteria bacterium]|nr:tetratricopeptide repeat protein [Deltaproteobacteria bacterium]